jgi:hypothetical protein
MDLSLIENYLKELASKSCDNASDLSLLNNPNLEADRVTLQFIQKLVDQTSLLPLVTTLTRTECRGEIPRFDSCDIPAVGASATSCLPGFKIQDDYLTYNMVKYKVAHSYDQDMVDCNKYGSQIKNIAMQMLMTKFKNAMEIAAIQGDEDIPTGDDRSDWENLLGVNDGWLKLALNCTPEAQIIDAQGAGLSLDLFMAAKRALPARYKAARGDFKFIGGPTLADWYAQTFGNRVTNGGDEAIRQGVVGPIWGVDLVEVNQWKENYTYGQDDEVTHILYTPTKNLVHLMQRKLDFKTEYKMEADKYLTVGYFRQDVMISDPDAVVLIKNVSLCDDTPWAGCKTPAPGKCPLP